MLGGSDGQTVILLDRHGREAQLLPILMGDSLVHEFYSAMLGTEGYGLSETPLSTRGVDSLAGGHPNYSQILVFYCYEVTP